MAPRTKAQPAPAAKPESGSTKARSDPAGPRQAVSARGRTREALLVEHAAARHRRDGAVLGSDEHREAALEVERIEVAIAALERSMVPPRM